MGTDPYMQGVLYDSDCCNSLSSLTGSVGIVKIHQKPPDSLAKQLATWSSTGVVVLEAIHVVHSNVKQV